MRVRQQELQPSSSSELGLVAAVFDGLVFGVVLAGVVFAGVVSGAAWGDEDRILAQEMGMDEDSYGGEKCCWGWTGTAMEGKNAFGDGRGQRRPVILRILWASRSKLHSNFDLMIQVCSVELMTGSHTHNNKVDLI